MGFPPYYFVLLYMGRIGSELAAGFIRLAGCITPGHKESRRSEPADPPDRGDIHLFGTVEKSSAAQIQSGHTPRKLPVFDAAISRIIAVRPYRR